MSHGFSFVIILVIFFMHVAAGRILSKDNDVDKCVYTLYVRTGSTIKGGTDSKISVTLGDADADGRSVWIPNLENWGLMGPTHDYFEMGNLDVFSGRGPCISTPICRLNLTSDGTGSKHGWYCNYVEVTSTGPQTHCSQSIFYVEQWLATDVPPYQLTAILDGCHTIDSAVKSAAAADQQLQTTTETSINIHNRKKRVPFIVRKAEQNRLRVPQAESSSSSSTTAAQ